MNASTGYWLIIEPYVYLNVLNNNMLLFNTLDGQYMEISNSKIISLVNDVMLENNFGITSLGDDTYAQSEMMDFVNEMRNKFIGDVIPKKIFSERPVQIFPYVNNRVLTKSNLYNIKDISLYLREINIHVDKTIEVDRLIETLKVYPKNLTLNLTGNLKDVESIDIFNLLNVPAESRHILCSYTSVPYLKIVQSVSFSYKIIIQFPIDQNIWSISKRILNEFKSNIEYILDVISIEDCVLAEDFVNDNEIELFRLNPIYNGHNLSFFENLVFLNKSDILSPSIKMKNIFQRHLFNENDFGKIHIIPNGDVYANLHFPKIGNIYEDNVLNVIQEELINGKSWLRVRNQSPCNSCLYQWLCPSPSDYELQLGFSNLCHVK